MDLKIVTFNIRCDYGQDGENQFCYRKDLIKNKIEKEHPDIQIYCGHLDRELNKDCYICPGLGDAGDRIFGTK